jgi:hypothetical protein
MNKFLKICSSVYFQISTLLVVLFLFCLGLVAALIKIVLVYGEKLFKIKPFLSTSYIFVTFFPLNLCMKHILELRNKERKSKA